MPKMGMGVGMIIFSSVPKFSMRIFILHWSKYDRISVWKFL